MMEMNLVNQWAPLAYNVCFDASIKSNIQQPQAECLFHPIRRWQGPIIASSCHGVPRWWMVAPLFALKREQGEPTAQHFFLVTSRISCKIWMCLAHCRYGCGGSWCTTLVVLEDPLSPNKSNTGLPWLKFAAGERAMAATQSQWLHRPSHGKCCSCLLLAITFERCLILTHGRSEFGFLGGPLNVSWMLTCVCRRVNWSIPFFLTVALTSYIPSYGKHNNEWISTNPSFWLLFYKMDPSSLFLFF